MATISGTPPINLPAPQTHVGGRDSDGDNDASKAAVAAPVPAPVISKPTQTMGNNVNTHA